MSYWRSYKKGDNLACCDVCGQTYLASQMKMRWDNLFVCHFDMEIRHPQDFVRAIPDDMRADPARPPPADVFIDPADPIDPSTYPPSA
jgi:hypothetical protein